MCNSRPRAKDGLYGSGEENLRQLTSVARSIAEMCNMVHSMHHPYTGSSAFAHKGGLHASAIARFPEAYEHTKPEKVGNATRVLVSELAGKASLVAKAKSLGFDLSGNGALTQQILDDIKERENQGFLTKLLMDRWRCCFTCIWGPLNPISLWKVSALSWTTKKIPMRGRRMQRVKRLLKSILAIGVLLQRGRNRPCWRIGQCAASGTGGCVS